VERHRPDRRAHPRLGHYAPGTYKEYIKLGSIKETDGVPKAERWCSS
jgi:hypothetical protein